MTALQQQALSAGHADAAALSAASIAGLVLVFGLWWSYFQRLSPRPLRRSLRVTFAWAYAHYAVFAAVAALAAGMQVVIDSLSHHTTLSPVFAALTVAIPVVIYLVVQTPLAPATHRRALIRRAPFVGIGATLIVVAALSARILTLPTSTLIMAFLVATMVAVHMAVTKTTSAPRTGS